MEKYKYGNPKYPYGKEHLKSDAVASGLAMTQAKNKLPLRNRFKAWIKGLTPMEMSVESIKERERNAKKKEREDEESLAEDFSDDKSEAESEAESGAEASDDGSD